MANNSPSAAADKLTLTIHQATQKKTHSKTRKAKQVMPKSL
ncbi:hypothetical protein [Moraxella marmotae]